MASMNRYGRGGFGHVGSEQGAFGGNGRQGRRTAHASSLRHMREDVAIRDRIRADRIDWNEFEDEESGDRAKLLRDRADALAMRSGPGRYR